jgi:hypothetical protein
MTEPTRISYDVQRGKRDDLIAALIEFADHRAEQGKTARADGARAAAQQLADGAERVRFEYTEYVVDADPGRGGVRQGSREWVLAELEEGGEAWTHHGNRLLAIAHAAAIREIDEGATEVTVGHLTYVVVE